MLAGNKSSEGGCGLRRMCSWRGVYHRRVRLPAGTFAVGRRYQSPESFFIGSLRDEMHGALNQRSIATVWEKAAESRHPSRNLAIDSTVRRLLRLDDPPASSASGKSRKSAAPYPCLSRCARVAPRRMEPGLLGARNSPAGHIQGFIDLFVGGFLGRVYGVPSGRCQDDANSLHSHKSRW